MSKPLHKPTEKTRAEIIALRSYGVTDLVKIKALIKAAAKGVKEVLRKQHNKEGDGLS